MGAKQIAEMEPSLREVYAGVSGPDDPPTACCTMESVNLSGAEVWLQAMPGTVNMAYPLASEPLSVLRERGVRCPAGFYLVEWAAGEYATFGFDNIAPRDHAFFADQLFVKVLGCDGESYALRTTIEPLET
jgi:hypothetical protein